MELVEAGHPAQNAHAYRRCLGQFGTGVAIITTADGDRLAGMTSNSFASVSLDPPLILWSIRRASSSFTTFEASKHFAVNVLASDQVALSQKFAKSGPDKFADVKFDLGVAGIPLLHGAVARLECRTVTTHDGGDHLIMVGQVERYSRHKGREALMFVQGRYATAVDHPNSASSEPYAVESPLQRDMEPLSSLLAMAYSNTEPALATARQIQNLGLMEARLLRGIITFPGHSLSALLPELLLSVNAAEDVLKSLIQRKLVQQGTEGRLTATSGGQACFVRMLAHASRLETDQLREVAARDIECVRRVLWALATKNGKIEFAQQERRKR
jgi:flavin reductase (DIM6/NTAB) family NADH-FMN oxidoreductase RutF